MKIAYAAAVPMAPVSAPALRVASVARALSTAGHSVEVISLVGTTGVAPEVRRSLGDGLHVTCLEYPDGVGAGKVTSVLRGSKELRSHLQRGDFDFFIGYGSSPVVWRPGLEGFPKARRCLDVVEWYSPDFTRPRALVHTLEHEVSMRSVSRHFSRMLVISEWLHDFYAARGVDTLLVPPLFSRSTLPNVVPAQSDGHIHVAFAGTVGGRKDSLTIRNLLVARRRMNEREVLTLHIIGPSSQELLALPGVLESDLSDVEVYGRVSHAQALGVVSSCHMTALQRPLKRYSRAGFPSKVVESWMMGVPILANETSDLGRYLRPGWNAVVLQGDTVEQMAVGLKRAVQVAACFDRPAISAWAASEFDTTVYGPSIAAFLC